MGYVLTAVYLATFYPREWTLVLGLSTAAWIFSNFLIHASLTLYTGEYSPGVVNGKCTLRPCVSVYLRDFFGFWNTEHRRHYRIYHHWFCSDVCSNAHTGREREETPPHLIIQPIFTKIT